MSKKKYKIGYTQGVFDMFHIGHLNLLNNAKKQCDTLIVGVNSDKLVNEYKGIVPNINELDRLAIVKNIKSVDDAIIVETLDKVDIYGKVKFDAVFIGDDWKGSIRWQNTEAALEQFGAEVVYLKRTEGVSSTCFREKIKGSVK